MGATQRERELNRLKQSILKDSQSSLSYKTVNVNDVDTHLMIDSATNPNIKEIKSLPNETFTVGDYIVWNNSTWLVTKADIDSEVYVDGQMELTNHILKFQSPDGTILSYPCITSTNNTLGVDENNTLTTPNGTIHIKLPFDENTNTLREDRRLYIDRDMVNPRSYKITKVNNVEYAYGDKGLIELTLEQCASGENDDRPDLGICDYRDPSTTPTPPEGTSYATITCSNPNNEITIGSSVYRSLTPSFYNADGSVATGVTAVWNLELPTGYTNAFTIVYDGNLAKIKVAENYDLLGVLIKANVSNGNNLYKGSIQLLLII
jgi:hypothetical protein